MEETRTINMPVVPATLSLEPKKMGRPPIPFTEEVAESICLRISEGESLRTICKDETMPSIRTVMRWLIDTEKKDFWQQYAQARESQAEHMFGQLIEIADDGINDWVEKERRDGSTYESLNMEAVMRSKLRVDTRKWILSKMQPKKYGDKLDVTTDGEKVTKVNVEIVNGTQPKGD